MESILCEVIETWLNQPNTFACKNERSNFSKKQVELHCFWQGRGAVLLKNFTTDEIDESLPKSEQTLQCLNLLGQIIFQQ